MGTRNVHVPEKKKGKTCLWLSSCDERGRERALRRKSEILRGKVRSETTSLVPRGKEVLSSNTQKESRGRGGKNAPLNLVKDEISGN